MAGIYFLRVMDSQIIIQSVKLMESPTKHLFSVHAFALLDVSEPDTSHQGRTQSG